MTEARQNTIVGLFALVGLAVMAVLVFAFGGGRALFARTYDIKVHFPRGVVGVQEGQGVTLHGKRIGETKAVEFYLDRETGEERPEKGVHVIVAVGAEYDIPKSARVEVATSIMGLGRPSIRLVIDERTHDPGVLPHDGEGEIEGRMIPILDQVLPPEMQQTLNEATASLDELATALTPVARHLARLLEARDVEKVDLQELTANIDTVIQRFDGTLRNVNALLGDEQNLANLKGLLANLKTMSDNGLVLVNNLNELSDDGKHVLKDGGNLLRKLAGATDGLSSVLTRMDQSLAMLNEGEGTAALFLRDNRLYEELLLTAKRLTKTLDELREVLDLAKKGKLRIKMF
jgi:phospholipid/cholesterol/gamma-HCH transport system substrate-binding protein